MPDDDDDDQIYELWSLTCNDSPHESDEYEQVSPAKRLTPV